MNSNSSDGLPKGSFWQHFNWPKTLGFFSVSILTTILVTTLLVVQKRQELRIRAEQPATLPLAPQGYTWQLIFSDEFDGGQIDSSKWEVIGDEPRRDGWWVKEDAYLDGQGRLVLRTKRDGERYTSGAVRTKGKFEHAFGFYEARIQFPTQEGHWPAFWLFSNSVNNVDGSGRDGTEIDIIEKPWTTDLIHHALHWDGYGDAHQAANRTEISIPGISQGWHTVGLDWRPDSYTFYVDQNPTWSTSAGGVSQVPQYIKLTEEVGVWVGSIQNANLPDYFVIDYVRVYDLIPLAETPTPTPKPTATPTPSAGTSVSWVTPYALFQADNFYILANGKRYYANTGVVEVRSDPGNQTYTTLEVTWHENGDEMRMYIYLHSDGYRWWTDEIRTYNGQVPNDWIYYMDNNTFLTNLGYPYIQNTPGGFVKVSPTTGQVTSEIHYSNLRVQAFLGATPPPTYNPSPTATATSYPTPTPVAECQMCGGIAGIICGSGLTCNLVGSYPDASGTCVKTNGTSNCSGSPSPSPTPQPQVLNFLIKFVGVAEGSADGAGVSATFQSSENTYVTPPLTAHYIANGIYRISFIPSNPFPNVTFNGQQQVALKYLISLKGEKHLKTKFCSNTGIITRCNQTASFSDGMFIDATGGTYDFTSFPLEPGDLYPQNGLANSSDFVKIKNLMDKPCANLTVLEKLTGDLDYNGCINVRDAFLMRQTLQTRYDEN